MVMKKYLVGSYDNIVYVEAYSPEEAWAKSATGNGIPYVRGKFYNCITELNDKFDIERAAMNVVGFASQKRHGKDEAANYLAKKLNELGGKKWDRVSLATPVKQIYCESFNVDNDFIEKWKVVNDIPPNLLKSVRDGLIFIGDGFRSIYPNIWIDKLFNSLNKDNGSIISDCRYFNELRAVRNAGGYNVLIARKEMLNTDDNKSESEIRPLLEYVLGLSKERPKEMDLIDYVIMNNGTLEELQKQVEVDLMPAVQKYFTKG